MLEPPSQRTSKTALDSNLDGNGALEELRRLLLGREQVRISDLARHVEDPAVMAEDVSAVLPQAFAHCARTDSRLSHAMAPAIEASLQSSIRRNPSILSNTIFPVLGPAIRRAVADALRRMVRAFSAGLDHSFSWKGLRWRFEAWRTGRPYAEVVLLHTLVFRVERVFLVHRPTGLLLLHVAAPGVDVSDDDLIAGMLTAVRDFVRDSFNTEPGAELSDLRVGDVMVRIESGPHAVLAAAIRGEAPVALHHRLQRCLERIHRDEASRLAAFEGDAAPFEWLAPTLEDCLESKVEVQFPERASWRLWAVLIAIGGLGGWWAWTSWENHAHRSAFVRALKTEPGFVITEVVKSGGRLHVAGLRDPLAREPELLASEAGMKAGDVIWHWEPYQAHTPEFTLRRAHVRLEPPEGVQMSLEGGVLNISGDAPAAWWAEARYAALSVPGVEGVRIEASPQPDPAPEPRSLEAQLGEVIIGFGVARTNHFGTVPEIETVARLFERIRQEADPAHAAPTLLVTGHADRSGTDDVNLRLSQDRAEWVRGQLIQRGVAAENVVARGVGSQQPVAGEAAEAGTHRRVTFSIRWPGVEDTGP